VREDTGGFALVTKKGSLLHLRLLTGCLHLSKGQLVDVDGRLRTRQRDAGKHH